MRAGVERSGQRAAGLADADAAHSAGHDHNAECEQDWSPGEQCKRNRAAPMNERRRRAWLPGFGSCRLLFVLGCQIEIASENANCGSDHCRSTPQQ